MINYIWIIVLGVLSIASLVLFVLTITRTTVSIKKLRLKKYQLVWNIFLLVLALADISVIIYVFLLIKEQINILS